MIAEDFAGRVRPFDSTAAVTFADICADRRVTGRPISFPDCQIIATARAHGASIATGNISDFEGCGVEVRGSLAPQAVRLIRIDTISDGLQNIVCKAFPRQDVPPTRGPMLSDVVERREQIAALCRRHHVRRLELFGSSARGIGFDPARSDLDLLLEFNPDSPPLSGYFALRDGLTELLGRRMDLVAPAALRNPYLRTSVDRARVEVYEK